MLLRTFAALAATALLCACAMSPMTIAVNPVIDVDSLPLGRQQSLSVNTIDQRSSPVLGNRGGVYNTAYVSTSANFTQSVNQALVNTFRRLDFNANAGQGGPAHVTFQITELRYISPPNQLGGPLEVRAKIAVQANKHNRHFNGNYSSSRTMTVAVAATPLQNQQIVNQTVSQALTNAMKDPKLQRFLAQ